MEINRSQGSLDFNPERKEYVSPYFNTVPVHGEELKEKEKKVRGQNAEILHVFANAPMQEFTPWDIYDKLQGRFPITSVRARITTLEHAGYLEKTSTIKESGPHDGESNCWKLNPKSI